MIEPLLTSAALAGEQSVNATVSDELPLDTGPATTAPVPDDVSELPGLTVTADPGPLAYRLRLRGRLDVETVSLLTSCLDGWARRGMRHVVIDVTETTSIDHVGARALTSAAHVLSRQGGSLSVIAPRNLTKGPLASCGLDLVSSGDGAAVDTVIGIRHVG